MRIYGISGLGADHRVFSILNNFLKIPVTYVPWIAPCPNESLEEYSKRLAQQVEPVEDMVLIGVSLGGMVAVEISKFLKFKSVIIISSAGEAKELPKSLVVLGISQVFKWIPTAMIVPPAFVSEWFFGLSNDKYKPLLNEIISDTDKAFAKWAINQIPKWQNNTLPQNLIRIHGENDRVLPMKSGLDYKIIKKAGHFAVVENAEEIAALINKEIISLNLPLE
jgi:pimeloyl-ACP methyl ester carboxylesterase